jgi:radical SAM protein with 4Fe4S-binding SPASM domain
MANISITSACNRSCGYCFAREAYDRYADLPEYMHLETYETILNFLDRSQISQVRLLGGEPTLHPRLKIFIEMAIARNKKLIIFSNGHINRNNLRLLSGIPAEILLMIINVSITDRGDIRISEEQDKMFKLLGDKAMVGLNIYKPNARLNDVIDIIKGYNLKKSVRLGLAHPCINIDNKYLKAAYYGNIGNKVTGFAEKARRENIKISFDCGFVPCMFNSMYPGNVWPDATQCGLTCGPVIDILTDGSAVPCYPLASVARKKIMAEDNLDIVIAKFKKDLLLYRSAGIYPECSECIYKNKGLCEGGCLALTIKRYRKADFSLLVKER